MDDLLGGRGDTAVPASGEPLSSPVGWRLELTGTYRGAAELVINRFKAPVRRTGAAQGLTLREAYRAVWGDVSLLGAVTKVFDRQALLYWQEIATLRIWAYVTLAGEALYAEVFDPFDRMYRSRVSRWVRSALAGADREYRSNLLDCGLRTDQEEEDE